MPSRAAALPPRAVANRGALTRRVMQGTLRGFDQMVNLILEESHERVYSPTAGVALEVLGLFVVRGDNVYVRPSAVAQPTVC